MNDLEKKSIECIKNMPIEETTYQVARNVVLDYIANLQQKYDRAVEYIKENAKYKKVNINNNKYYSEYIINQVLDILNGDKSE